MQQADVVEQHVAGAQRHRLGAAGREAVPVALGDRRRGARVGPAVAARHHPDAGIQVGVVEVEVGDEHRRFDRVIVGAGAVAVPRHGDALAGHLQHHGVLGRKKVGPGELLHGGKHARVAHHGARGLRLVDHVLDAAQHPRAVQVPGTVQVVGRVRMCLSGHPVHVGAHRRQFPVPDAAGQHQRAVVAKRLYLNVGKTSHEYGCNDSQGSRQTRAELPRARSSPGLPTRIACSVRAAASGALMLRACVALPKPVTRRLT